MNLRKRSLRIAAVWRLLALLCLLMLPGRGWSEPPAAALPEQLRLAHAAEDYASTEELCRRELERSPGDVALFRQMFTAQLQIGAFDRAKETLARLGKTSAKPALLAELRGDLDVAAGKPIDGVPAWKEALGEKPDDAPELLGKIADAFDAAGRWPEAVEAFRAFLRAKPSHAARTSRFAVCLLNAGYPEEADKQALAAGRIDAADKTVKADAPVFDRLRPRLPELRKLGERIAALNAGPVAARPGGVPDPRIDRALIYYRAGAYNAALVDAQAAMAASSGASLSARLIEGECLWRLDREKEAVELRVAKIEDARWFDDARRCQRLRAPDELSGKEDAATVVRAYAACAMVLLDGGQPVLALEDAEKAAGAEEKSGRRTADTEVVLAATLLRNDRPGDALAAAGRATQDDPRNPDGWALRGRLEQESANFAAAVEDLSQALAIREDASWLRRRETCLRILGRNSEADRDAQRAAQAPAST